MATEIGCTQLMGNKSYRPWMPDQLYLLPPSPREWLPEGHLVYFLLDVLAELDLHEIEGKIQAKDPRGTRPYSPRMMLGLLIYGYCLGVRSSRRLERLSYEDVAVRVLTGGQHPDHSRISAFRREHQGAFRGLFLQVLRLCQKAGLVKLGHVSIDGTKLQANASKHKAMSYARMEKQEQRLEAEIERMLEEAERADQEEDARFGVGQKEEDLPKELRRREDRLARLRAAKAELEAEARQSRAQKLREQAARARRTAEASPDETVVKRSRTRARKLADRARALQEDPPEAKATQLPHHRVRVRPDATPHPKAQRNFTDSDSRLMESRGAFLQGYNCQAAVDEKVQVIVAADLTNQAPDSGNLLPMVHQVGANCGSLPEVVSADCGYWSPEAAEGCETLGTDGYIATQRERDERRSQPCTEPEEGEEPSLLAAMQRRLQSEKGRALYARRKVIVEPVFGQIKEARGIRRFLLRGLESATAEWQLICCTHNLLKIFRHEAGLPA